MSQSNDKSVRTVRSMKDVVDDGFRPADLESDRIHPDLMFASARLALRAFAETSRAIHGSLHVTEPADSEEDQKTRDFNLSSRYRDAAFETIIHLQHFAELVIKDALRRDHELLVVITGDEHELLHRLLHGETLQGTEERKLQAVEASLALRRLCALRKVGRLDPTYDFVVTSRQFLEVLNGLRNRLWHRGTYTLRFAALDELVGRYALPFVHQVCAHAAYQKRAAVLEPQPLACGIKPFDEIAAELSKTQWSVRKVAFLKELARAAYENPFFDSPWFKDDNDRLRKRAELVVNEFPEHAVAEVIDCPVCGVEACAVYVTSDLFEDEHGNECSRDWTWLAKCEACTLELRAEYGNPSEHGWTTIPDLWREV